jgi:hypothetical protein
MEAGFWNANSRTNEIAFKFGTELTSTSRRFDRFAPKNEPASAGGAGGAVGRLGLPP